MRFDRGTVVLIALDSTTGHEQRGTRPCILVSNPDVTADERFPVLCVIQTTGTPGQGALYPELGAGSSGLRQRSYALLDQIRTVDKRRVHRVFGKIASKELNAVDEGLRLLLGLG